MDFVLRIFFSGLIAFVPSADRKELTVLLLETPRHAMSDGVSLPEHKPVLLARAQECKGDCNAQNAELAEYFYADLSDSQAATALDEALQGGGAWVLDNSDLAVGGTVAGKLSLHRSAGQKKLVPGSPAERQDFTWVADLRKIAPSLGQLNPSLFAARPPKAIVAARLRLTSGDISTYSLIRVGKELQPIHFRSAASKSDVPYEQAVANWVTAEIRASGDSVQLMARNFDDPKKARSMTLTPIKGQKERVVEIAILNLPPFKVPTPGARPAPQPGRHFEVFYDLAKNPPPASQRPIPHVGAASAQLDWQAVHPSDALFSPLLNQLRLDAGRGPYDVLLCPVSQADRP
jgi:hypothetical protein